MCVLFLKSRIITLPLLLLLLFRFLLPCFGSPPPLRPEGNTPCSSPPPPFRPRAAIGPGVGYHFAVSSLWPSFAQIVYISRAAAATAADAATTAAGSAAGAPPAAVIAIAAVLPPLLLLLLLLRLILLLLL